MRRLPRASGVLAHVTSLPGRYGIGDLGPGLDQFLGFLQAARQHLWQVLPLTPTGFGASPYAAPSAFAGNPLLVSPERLIQDGLLTAPDVAELEHGARDRVDFARVERVKRQLLDRTLERLSDRSRLEAFRERERGWLEDYTLFAAMSEEFGTPWTDWDPPLRDREPGALREARQRLARQVDAHALGQWLFHEQWARARAEAARREIRIVGDIPIFVALDSADVWANREHFKLDARGRPTVVAGVPPDYFSETGQLWGNPLYDWDSLRADGFAWWTERFRQLLRNVEIVRIDHFRGFQAAWAVPADAPTAQHGQWVPGPGAEVFRAVERALGADVPVIAEDLGLITDAVRALLAEVGYPGMKVLQFAFSGDPLQPYLPHTYEDPNCVVYTGTHDNDTSRGWYGAASEEERDFLRRYLGSSGEDATWDLIRLALSSVADTAILPLQDVLDLGSEARMNVPGAAEGNWRWRVSAEDLRADAAERLAELTVLYGRHVEPQSTEPEPRL